MPAGPLPALESWVFQIPRPMSLNDMIGANRYAVAARKRKFIEDVRWCLKADREFAARLPYRCRLEVDITILGLWHGAPDCGNWEKWIGDALAGFAMLDDGDRFWTYHVHFDTGRPGAILRIRETTDPVPDRPFPQRRKIAAGRVGSRWPRGLVKILRPGAAPPLSRAIVVPPEDRRSMRRGVRGRRICSGR